MGYSSTKKESIPLSYMREEGDENWSSLTFYGRDKWDIKSGEKGIVLKRKAI